MNFAKFNTYRFAYDSISAEWPKDETSFTSLADLYAKYGPDNIFEIKSIWIRNAKEGDGSINKENPIVTIEGIHVNIPQHQLEQIRNMLNDPGVVEYVDNGGAGFTIREYDNQYKPGEKAYAARWCNTDDGSHI